jgi:anti-sigma-K factor RskA
MDYSRPELVERLAAQYVAGTLRGPARRRLEALLPAHPALREAVAAWSARLMPLTGVVAPQAPPPHVWRGIERRLWLQAADAAAPPSWWQRLAPWRAISALATIAAVSLALWQLPQGPAQPPVIVVLQGTGGEQQGQGAFVASFSADGRALVTQPLRQVNVAADRVLELWSVPEQGAPKSLGLISASGVTVLPRERLPAGLLRGATQALAVSVEPPGGSPTGAPTGPVVYAGKLQL